MATGDFCFLDTGKPRGLALLVAERRTIPKSLDYLCHGEWQRLGRDEHSFTPFPAGFSQRGAFGAFIVRSLLWMDPHDAHARVLVAILSSAIPLDRVDLMTRAYCSRNSVSASAPAWAAKCTPPRSAQGPCLTRKNSQSKLAQIESVTRLLIDRQVVKRHSNKVCKTFIRRFDSDPRLQEIST